MSTIPSPYPRRRPILQAKPLFVTPPPVVLPPPLPKIAERTRVCEWCAKSIPKQAVKCSFCHKWRNDINRARQKVIKVIAGFVGSVFFTLLACGVIAKSSYLWYETVKTVDRASGSSTLHTVNGMTWAGPGPITPRFPGVVYVGDKSNFSIEKFLDSSEGWGVIALVICSCGFLAGAGYTALKRT